MEAEVNLEMAYWNLDFWGERKTEEPSEKPPGAEQRTSNQLNPLMAANPESNQGQIGGGGECNHHYTIPASLITITPSLIP